MKVTLDGALQPAHAFGNDFRGTAREVHAHRRAIVTVRIEHAARHESDFLFQRELVKLVGIDARIRSVGPLSVAAIFSEASTIASPPTQGSTQS